MPVKKAKPDSAQPEHSGPASPKAQKATPEKTTKAAPAKAQPTTTGAAKTGAARSRSRPAAAAEGTAQPRAGRRKPETPRDSEAPVKTAFEEVEVAEGYQPSPGEPYMSPRQLAYFRRKLLDWRDALLRESQQTIDHLRSDGASRYVGDEADRARDESEVALELRTRDRYRKLLPKIDAALKRIEDGTYGFCEETGEPIGLKRLEARPIATLSVEAQELRERAQRGFRDDT
jgi:DnaK suppressor protein